MLTVKRGAKVILKGTLSSNLAWFGGPLVTSNALVRHYFVFKNLSNLQFSKFKKFKNLKNFIIKKMNVKLMSLLAKFKLIAFILKFIM